MGGRLEVEIGCSKYAAMLKRDLAAALLPVMLVCCIMRGIDFISRRPKLPADLVGTSVWKLFAESFEAHQQTIEAGAQAARAISKGSACTRTHNARQQQPTP